MIYSSVTTKCHPYLFLFISFTYLFIVFAIKNVLCKEPKANISYGTFSKIYCGASKPDPVTSTGNTMKFKFHSDYSVVKNGFSAVWKAVAS